MNKFHIHKYNQRVCLEVSQLDGKCKYYEALMCSCCKAFKKPKRVRIINFNLPLLEFKKDGKHLKFTGNYF